MKHLEVMAAKIMRDHTLRMIVPEDIPALEAYISAVPSTHEVTFLKNGREKWGPELKWDYADYRIDHKVELARDYPLERLYWPVAFRHWHGNGFQAANRSTWFCWYATILGNPYSDFPAELNWKTLLYQLWIDQSKKWRNDWKKAFIKEHPRAAKLDIFSPQMNMGRAWEGWRLYAFLYGLEQTEKLWRGEALLDMEHILSLV